LTCALPVVLIGRNGPPVGAPGFKSHRSIVDGPPPIHSRIADLRFWRSWSALAAIACPNENADDAIAAEPARCMLKCRRVIPAGVRKAVGLIECYLALVSEKGSDPLEASRLEDVFGLAGE